MASADDLPYPKIHGLKPMATEMFDPFRVITADPNVFTCYPASPEAGLSSLCVSPSLRETFSILPYTHTPELPSSHTSKLPNPQTPILSILLLQKQDLGLFASYRLCERFLSSCWPRLLVSRSRSMASAGK
ncbi:hypothetical protein [Algoriphagus taiwanensis]|uniref:hypothetical protein n=1 Tax=Algoriphagus taiwanensis TaxID=1445656 RepID=UPI0030C6EB74